MFDPDAHLPRINRSMVYLGACLIAGIRLARERQVNVGVIPTSTAIDESVDCLRPPSGTAKAVSLPRHPSSRCRRQRGFWDAGLWLIFRLPAYTRLACRSS